MARFGSRAAHVPVLTGPAVARQLDRRGAAAASLDGVVLLPHERVGPDTVAHEVAHALQQTAGGADAHAAMADTPALLERMAHAPVVPEGTRAETEARVGEATAQAVPAAPQSVLPPGVVSLRRTGRTPPIDVPPASAPEAADRAVPAPLAAATPAGPQAEAARADASAASAVLAADSAPAFALPEFVEPTLDPAAASERAAEAAAAQQALAVADSPDAVMAAYAAMPPSQQAVAQSALGARLAETAAISNAALGEATPEVAARSRGGEGPPPTPAPVSVPADAPALDLGNAPAPTIAVPEAPAQPAMRVDPAYGPALERRFAESATPERVGESIEAVSTRNPGIETAVRERAEVPIDGANDPRRLEDALASQRAQASTLRQGAAQAVIDGPGPEQVAPRALEATAPAPEFPGPRLDALQPAPEAAQLQQLALPDAVIAGFDQDSAAQMAASADAARRQMADAQGTRDTAHGDAVQQAQVQRQDAETRADDSQREAVVAQRQTIQNERQRTVDDQNTAMAGINADAAQARDDRREEAQREVAAGQQRIDARYDQAETDAEAAVRRGEQEAERERERKRRESQQASWWDRAVDFIRSAFEALTALISGIFDAVRSAVTGLIELARQAVVGLIQAVSAALQAIVSALGEVLRGLVDRLLGEIFPELARRLNAAIDAAVNAVNRAIDTVASALVEAVNAIAAALTSAVNAVLDAFQAAVNSALAVLQAALTGDWGALLVRVLDAVLRVLGIEPAAFHALIAQAADAVTTIVNDPGRFVANMLDVVVGGIRRFASNFFDHFRRGIIGWLTGALGDIQIPSEWNLWTVLDLARQILGLTWDFVRERAARLIGPENVARLEMMGSWIGTLITEGWQGLWTRVQESLASLRDSVLEAIRNFVLERVIMAAIGWLASMFNPVGALVRLVMMIWNLYQFVSAQMQRLFGIAQAVVGAISNIARGVLEPGQRAVEAVLGNLVPVVIDLLMSLLGVTGVAARVRQIIQDLRQRIADAVDRMLQRVLQTLGLRRGAGAGEGEREAAPGAAAGTPDAIGHPVRIEAGAAGHTLTIERAGAGGATVMLRSEPRPLVLWLDTLTHQAALLEATRRTEANGHIGQARALLGRMDPLADRIAAVPAGAPAASNEALAALEGQIVPPLQRAFNLVEPAGGAHDVKTEALEALRAQFNQARPGSIAAVQASANAIKGQFAARGITRLEVVGAPDFQAELRAEASPATSVTVRLNEVLSAPSLQPNQALFNDIVRIFSGQGRGSETLAVVSVNGQAMGGRRNAEEHAEQELLASPEWEQAVARADSLGTPENKADLVMLVNRSPCGAICTDVLSRWLRPREQSHPNVRFVIAASGRYAPQASKDDLIRAMEVTFTALEREPPIPFAIMEDLPRRRIEAIFREHVGRLFSEATLRRDEMTTQADLARLASAGWQLRQLQVVESVLPAQRNLADMLRRLGQDLGSTLRVTV